MKKILTFSLVLALGVSLACQQKTKPDLQARRDSIKVDSLSSLPAVLFNTALEAEKKQVGKAKEIYAKLAKDSTFWSEQARLRLEFLSVKEVKEHILKGVVGTWKVFVVKKAWSRQVYNIEIDKILKIYPNGTAEWFENGILKKKTTYKLYDGELSKKNPEDVIQDNIDADMVGNIKAPEFQCLIFFEKIGLHVLRKKHNTMSLNHAYICGGNGTFYKRVE